MKIFQILLVVVLAVIVSTEGYGYRYRYDPYTQQTQLWTHLPGMELPVVYDNNQLVGSQSKLGVLEDNPGLYQYTGVNGKLRWQCKTDAYYSEYMQKCLWKPGHYFSKTG